MNKGEKNKLALVCKEQNWCLLTLHISSAPLLFKISWKSSKIKLILAFTFRCTSASHLWAYTSNVFSQPVFRMSWKISLYGFHMFIGIFSFPFNSEPITISLTCWGICQEADLMGVLAKKWFLIQWIFFFLLLTHCLLPILCQ